MICLSIVWRSKETNFTNAIVKPAALKTSHTFQARSSPRTLWPRKFLAALEIHFASNIATTQEERFHSKIHFHNLQYEIQWIMLQLLRNNNCYSDLLLCRNAIQVITLQTGDTCNLLAFMNYHHATINLRSTLSCILWRIQSALSV